MITRRMMLATGGAVLATPMLSLAALAAPPAGVWEARVSIDRQRMVVLRDGTDVAEWLVSTARPGKVTPKGTFKPYWLSRNHRSSLYNNAPMPFSVFFRGNYASHGTNEVARLGERASAGCVRLHTENAELLFNVAHYHGHDALTYVIT